jgi:hypothetical protein
MKAPEKPRLACLRGRTLALAAFVAVGTAGVAACGSDPFAIDWVESPDTVLLYSLARPQLNLVSGFDFYNRIAVRIEDSEATGNWDVAVDTRNGKIVLLAPGVLGVDSKARVARLPGTTFAEVIEAPADTTLYTATSPVPVELGSVYVMRTRQGFGSFGRVCVYYAKLEPLEIDPVGGTLRFVYDSSPVCNDRKLIPPN